MFRPVVFVIALLLAPALASAQSLDGHLKKIKETKTVAIAYRSDATPFSFVDQSKEPTGYSIDLCRRVVSAIAQQIGAEGVQIKWVPVSVQTRLEAIEKGQADMECGSTTVTLSRLKQVNFSSFIFVDGTGLSSENVSTAQELARLAVAAYRQALIRVYTTDSAHTVELANGRQLHYSNSNRLVKNAGWEIGLSKTGFINEAGRCLVMQAKIATKPVIIVLLDSWGKLTRVGDANRIKKWIESHSSRRPAG